MSEAVVIEAGGVAEDHANGQSSPEQTSTPTSPSVQAKSKVDILLKATGDAPIMKKKKWTVDRTKKLAYVSDFIRKFLKLDAQESLFIYVAQAFAPALDTELGTIYENYGSDNKLILHYCKTQAWG